MGVMKLIRTASVNGWPAANRLDQPIWNEIIRREKKRRTEQPEGFSELEGVYLRFSYVGWKPIESGHYLVIDFATSSQKAITLFKDKKGKLLVNTNPPTPLDSYNYKSMRWFRISPLSAEDISMIRQLPIGK